MAKGTSCKDREYHAARKEHAYFLRKEGLLYHQIGERLDVSKEQVRRMLSGHSRWLRPYSEWRTLHELKYGEDYY